MQDDPASRRLNFREAAVLLQRALPQGRIAAAAHPSPVHWYPARRDRGLQFAAMLRDSSGTAVEFSGNLIATSKLDVQTEPAIVGDRVLPC
jgi:hypothetical protein